METRKVANLETLRDSGIQKLMKVDGDYVEITVKGRTLVRQFYVNGNRGCFYLNNAKYSFEDISIIPNGEVTQPAQVEKLKKLSESMKGNNRAAGRSKEIDFSKVLVKKEEITPVEVSKDAKHEKYTLIKTCIEQDLPVYLVGEAGTGKNYTLQEIATDLELDFYFTNSVQQEFKITGFIDAGGEYHETEFYKAFTKGGLFFLDEIDASIPEVLVLLNAAIANRYFEFPNGRVDAHPDFRVVAAGNTVGSGANELYTGRLTLDSATLDRFVVIEFDYDRNIELMLAKGNEILVNFIRSLRDFCKTKGIRATFSYRAIISVTKLEAAGLDLKTILSIAVVKGLDKDTIKTLQVTNSGRYYFALRELQGVA
jgi:hypothetical protein